MGRLAVAPCLAAALGAVLLTGSQVSAQEQSAQGQSGQGGQEQSAASTLDLPLIGKIELPGFLSFLGSSDGGNGQGGAAGQGGDPPPPAVITQRAELQSVGDRFEFIGRIAAIQKVAVQARVAGYIDRVAFKGGEAVRKGDLLFQIQTAQYEAELAAAKAQLSGAQAQVNQARRSLNRNKELAQTGTVSQSTLDDAQASFESAEASQQQAAAAVQQAQLNLNYTTIVAPIDGTMSAPLITAGNYVSATSGPLANLIQLDPIWGIFPIGEGQLINWKKLGIGNSQQPAVEAQAGESAGGSDGGDSQPQGAGGRQADSTSPDTAEPVDPASKSGEEAEAPSASGSAAEGPEGPPAGAEEVGGRDDGGDRAANEAEDFVLSLILPNGSKYQPNGSFDFVDNTVSATTGTIETRIRFPNPEGYLLPNQNVTLVATQKDPPRLPVIPQAAVQLSRDGRSVLIVKEDDTIERRMITLAAEGGSEGTLEPGQVAVTSGLSGGENVVVRGAMTLKERQKVSPRPAGRPAGGGNAEPAATPSGQGSSAAGRDGSDGSRKSGTAAAGGNTDGNSAAGGGSAE
ncbi:efflux RND transporter periplasmic adaptor subunit [Aurantimonas sp. VKM B-3413]|uniref:efflux RND transporter periplasmic adaptor subunit n=1 Tax=Aurantimonas sp. VKM B-3413 TaxID=2779401 RepID=UPI001E4E8C49|nr:efflux RND transporter periplasmic adaptor subunit [Aurantimonas sp. VKM B-3413]